MRKKYCTATTLKDALDLILNNKIPGVNLVITVEEVLNDVKNAMAQMQDIGPQMQNCAIPNSVLFKTKCALEQEDEQCLVAKMISMDTEYIVCPDLVG